MDSKSEPDPIDIEVGLAIRRRRKTLNLSQEALARSVGITFQQIQKYEKGTNRISASMLVKTARTLQAQPADLLPKTNAPTAPKANRHMHLRGAEELVEGYAAIKSPRQRRAVLELVRALKPSDVLPIGEADDSSEGAGS